MTSNKSDGSSADYYVLPPDSKQLQDLISYRDMNAQIGEIFRACYRYGIVSHSDKLRDAKKIKFYAEAEIARLEKLLLKPVEPPTQEASLVIGAKVPWCDHMIPLDMTCYRCNPVSPDKCVHKGVPPGSYCNTCKAYNKFNGDE